MTLIPTFLHEPGVASSFLLVNSFKGHQLHMLHLTASWNALMFLLISNLRAKYFSDVRMVMIH